MRVFVTGGNGFIGSAVVRALVARGDDVVCLVHASSHTERIDDLPAARVARVPGDVRDARAVTAAMRGTDATIHLAAPGGWGEDDPATLESVIVDGTRTVVEAARETHARRLVNVSTTAAVAASAVPRVFDESAAFDIDDPALVYSHAKHRAERLVLDAAGRGLPAVVVNPGEVYGPNDTELGTARNLVDFATSWPVLVCRGGTAVVHVDDVVAGILAALDRGRVGERYILAGENATIRELAVLVCTLLGRRVPIVTIPTGVARAVTRVASRLRVPLPFEPSVVPYATRYWFVDAAKARRELGVTFRGARATIADTLAWLRSSGRLTSGG